MEHTKGPWKIEKLEAPVYGSDGSLVATGAGIGTESHHICTVYGRKTKANARLIAAAPELLEACKHMLRLMNGLGYHFDAMEDAEAAIAKAEGRE